MLGGPANVLVAEKHSGSGDPGNFTDARPKRSRIASSSDYKTTVTASDGLLAITVEARGEFPGGGEERRVTRFFKNHPRIEFETDLEDIPDLTVVVAEFPLAQAPGEVRRGIPFGFSRDDGLISGIVPAVRWSDYSSPGKGGVALLDRGLSGRDIVHHTPVICLLNATDKYYGYTNAWLTGKGRPRRSPPQSALQRGRNERPHRRQAAEAPQGCRAQLPRPSSADRDVAFPHHPGGA